MNTHPNPPEAAHEKYGFSMLANTLRSRAEIYLVETGRTFATIDIFDGGVSVSEAESLAETIVEALNRAHVAPDMAPADAATPATAWKLRDALRESRVFIALAADAGDAEAPELLAMIDGALDQAEGRAPLPGGDAYA